MKDFTLKETYDLEDYRALMHYLRSPDGCPWDREQTHESIRRNLIEEAYETANAIDRQDPVNLKEELGDLLMQVLFHAEIEQDRGGFNLDDVADAACKKLVFRHPHVFGEKTLDSAEALRTWEEQKKAEKGQKTVTDTLIGVAETLPALWRAEKIQKKAEALEDGILTSPEEALSRLSAAERTLCSAESASSEDRSAEIGRLLFAAVEVARAFETDPETALHKACDTYIRCADSVEKSRQSEGRKAEENLYLELETSFYGKSGE